MSTDNESVIGDLENKILRLLVTSRERADLKFPLWGAPLLP